MKKTITFLTLFAAAVPAIHAQTSLYGWGSSSFGALGNGAVFGVVFTPTQIGAANWRVIDAGLGYSTGIQEDGTLWAWGTDTDDQLGNGDLGDQTTPAQISADANWQKISCGLDHTIAIKADHTLWGWGNNIEGGLGTGNSNNLSVPTQIGDGTADWAMAAAGNHFTLAIKTDGTLWAWGDNNYGELGDGTHQDRYEPVQIGTGNDWKWVAAGRYFSFGIKNDGTLWAWGDNSFGGANVEVPTQVGTGNDWKTVASLDDSHFAIKTDGTLWAWGDNLAGQLGIGTNTSTTEMTQAGTATDWMEVAPGTDHTIFLKTDHTLWGTGLGASNGQMAASNTPLQIGTDNTWSAIASGSVHAFALKGAAPTGIQQINTGTEVVLYPNPATDCIRIRTKSAMESITFRSLNNRQVWQGKSEDINISRLSDGIYLYRIIFKNGQYAEGKFVKQ